MRLHYTDNFHSFTTTITGSGITQVSTFNDLPSSATLDPINDLYKTIIVRRSTGSPFTFNWKRAGLYVWEGPQNNWKRSNSVNEVINKIKSLETTITTLPLSSQIKKKEFDRVSYMLATSFDEKKYWVRRLSDGKEAYTKNTNNTAYATSLNSFWNARSLLLYEILNASKR